MRVCSVSPTALSQATWRQEAPVALAELVDPGARSLMSSGGAALVPLAELAVPAETAGMRGEGPFTI